MTDWGAIVGGRRVWVRDIVFTAATATSFALWAPFGVDRMPLQERLVEFLAVGFASFPLLWPPMRLALRLGRRAGLPELFVLIGGLVLLTVPVTLAGTLVIALFHPAAPRRDLLGVYFMILTMVLPFGSAYLLIERRLLRPAPAPDRPLDGSAAGSPRLFAQVSSRLGTEVLALQGEDHYVRVHTALGSELVLMRLGDAIRDLDGVPGERVHRSWWVARQAVGAVRPNGRRLSLTLTNGLQVPVSREAAPRLRRGGWLQR